MSWTIKTLKKRIDLQFKSNAKALKLSRKLMNKRLDGMNEIRAQLDRQVATFVSKDELKLTQQEIKSLSRLVYIGLGVWILLQPIIMYVLTMLYEK